MNLTTRSVWLQNGSLDYSYMVRHADPRLCPIGGFLLFLAVRAKTAWKGDLKELFPVSTEIGLVNRNW